MERERERVKEADLAERKDTLEVILYLERDKRLITLPKRERGEKSNALNGPTPMHQSEL